MINDYREARFPIRLPLEPDESGQGYLLRLGALNGFEKARQALTGKGWGSMPTCVFQNLLTIRSNPS